jgi:hypothetical protein
LSPLLASPPIANIEKLMRFTGELAAQAPWPQVRAVSRALLTPLTDEDRQSLLPYLTWPRDEKYMR